MKHRVQIDLVFGAILLSSFMGSLSSSASGPLGAGDWASAFPVSDLATAQGLPAEPGPAVFQFLARGGRVIVGQHVVTSKENLASLAKDYGTTEESLRSTNALDNPYLTPGQTLWVHPGKGMLHLVREVRGKTEEMSLIARRYNQSAVKIAQANRLPGIALLSGNWFRPGELLFIPDARMRFSDYMVPVSWARGKRFISSGFGVRRHPVYRIQRFHKGWDMPRPYGFPVRAAREATVIFADWRTGFGRLVILRHEGGVFTWYGHLSKITAAPGQKVKRGDLIGRVGSTGISTGPHLHFEVRDQFGHSLNPKKYLL